MPPSTTARRSRKLMRLVMGDPVIGSRVRQVRRQLALTQADFAELIGLETGQAVSNLERGESSVTYERARQLAVLSGKPTAYFLDAEHKVEEEKDAAVIEVDRLSRLEAQVGELQRSNQQQLALLHELRELLLPPAQETGP